MFRINRIYEEEMLYVFGAAFLLPVLWLAIAYFGVSGAIVYCLVFTFVFTSFSRLFYAWGRSSSLTLAETWLPPLISLAATSFVSLGIYYLVQFSQTGTLNGVVFYPWLSIMLGGPALYFLPPLVKRYLQLSDQARNCIESSLWVGHDVNLPICVDKLLFIDGTKNKELEIFVSTYRDDSNRDEIKEYKSLSQRINNDTRKIYYGTAFIPSGADKFCLSWYSVLEDKYYQGEFPFSFDVFSMSIAKYNEEHVRLWDHLHRKDVGVVSISIHPNGGVYLSQHSNILICYGNINNQIISDKKRENLLQHFRPYGKFSTSMVSELKSAELDQTANQLSQLGVNRKQVFNWCMRFENLNENNKLDVDDVARFSYRCTLEEFSMLDIRPLPEKIEVMYRSPDGLLPWLFIYLEVESLNRSVQLLTGGNKNVPVEFVVTVEDSHNNTIQFIINSNGQSVAFNAWETAVNEERKRKSRKLIKSAQQKKIQYQLLDSAWSDVKNRDYLGAEEKCDKLLSQTPVFKQVYFLQARLIFYKGGVAEYLSKIDDLVEKSGDDKLTLSRLHNSTGCVFDEEKRYAEALVYFEKASSFVPEEGMYLANIAELHYKLGHAIEAIKFAHQAKDKKFESDVMSKILKNSGMMSQERE